MNTRFPNPLEEDFELDPPKPTPDFTKVVPDPQQPKPDAESKPADSADESQAQNP